MSCITSVDGITLWLLICLVNYLAMLLVALSVKPCSRRKVAIGLCMCNTYIVRLYTDISRLYGAGNCCKRFSGICSESI